MSYYKYAERDASTEVNWAEIGKNLTQTFQDEVKVREEKKAAIDAATREYDNVLNTAPQGQFDNGNKFINNYVAKQQKIRMMDDQLLKSGRMDLKTYTTRRQNGIDGTTQLFDLQTKFQDVYSERLKGIMDGSLTAQNAFEMAQVQAFGDISKSEAVINNVDGTVSVGMTEIGEDGIKRVVPNSTIPASVLLGKMGTPLPSYDVNAETKRLVDSQGELVLSLFQAGSTTGAGSITELTGLDAIQKFGKGKWTEAAIQMNKAISQGVDSILANPRNIASLLTGQVGGYSSESFTYNKDEAAKDKNKILLKSSPDLGPGVIDENGPNYKDQEKKVREWLTTSIKSQMDAKVGKSATAQAQETALQRERAAYAYRDRKTNELPVMVDEVLEISSTDKKTGKKTITGVATGVQNLTIDEGKGVQNVIKSIGYNNTTGTLEVSGYQLSGTESEGQKGPVIAGSTGSSGATAPKQDDFISSDIKNARLLSAVVRKIPNPNRPGYNFSNINEAKNYYKRQYQRNAGESKPIQFDAEGNIIQ
jgi:hypothetical protein